MTPEHALVSPAARLTPAGAQTSIARLKATATTAPGTLRQDVVVDGRHRLVTDQPIGAGGGGAGPSPHELFAAALAACVSVTVAAYARTKRWDLGEIAVAVAYDHHATPRRCAIEVRVDAELSPELRARLERVAAACPLRRAIDAGFAFEEVVLGLGGDDGRGGATLRRPPP